METIAYVAPSAIIGIEAQIDQARAHGVAERFIRVDRPKKKGGETPRAERDFVFRDLLRSGADNGDGQPDRLLVASLDVLGDSRAEVWTLVQTLNGLGVPLVSLADDLNGDVPATDYAVRLVRALERAEGRIKRRAAAQAKRPRRARKGSVGPGRPPALTAEDVAEVVRLRDVERKTWPQIKAAMEERGRDAGLSTIRSRYAAAAAEK